MPPRKPTRPSDPPGALLLLLEVGGDQFVGDENKYLVKKLIADRIFTSSEDIICVSRIGLQNSSNTYCQASWEFLKDVMDELDKPAADSEADIIAELQNGIESVAIQALEGNCEEIKLIFFGHFEKKELKKKDILDLQSRCSENNVYLTFAFPKKEGFSATQTKNFELIESIIDELGENSKMFISDVVASIAKLANKIAEPQKKSVAYKFTLQIGSDVQIPVKKLIANREEKPSWDKYKKERDHISRKAKTSSSTPAVESPEEALVPSTSGESTMPLQVAEEVTNVVSRGEEVSSVATMPLQVAKEVKFVTSKGEEVANEEELQSGYLYGGEIVREEETAGSVLEPTEQCLQVLVFSPKDNIPPVCFLGDGTDMFLPQESEDAKAKFYALVEALEEKNEVAIVRYVYRKNAAAKMLALIPDKARKGLIAVHLCYADDASIPTFAPLIAEADLHKPPAAKDQLIDELMESLDISHFHPETGPMNPAIIKFRDEIANKVLYEDGKAGDNVIRSRYNTIDIMYPSTEELSEELIDKLKDAFPLTQKKTPNDVRPSGQKIFRKRHGSADFEADDDKKLKLDDENDDLSEDPMDALVQENEEELLEGV